MGEGRDEAAGIASGTDFEQGYWRSTPVMPGRMPELSPEQVDDDEFRLLADNIPTLCWIADGDGYIVWYNRRWHEYCGTTPEEMEGWGWQAVHDPEILPEVIERWTRSIACCEPFEMTFPLCGADGVYRPFLTRAQPLRDGSGAVVRWFGVNTEITAQAAAEQALRESEARFREVADAAPVLIWLADAGNKGTWYNKAWLDFTGRTMEQELGDGWIESVHPDDLDRCAAICGGSFDRREPFRLDFRMRRHDGEWRVIDDTGVPRFAEDGTFLGYIGSCTDVTDARRSEEALREQGRTLETLNRTGAAVSGELDLQKVVQMVTDAGVELTGAQFGAFFYNVIGETGESYMLFTLSGAERSQFDFGMPRNTEVFHPTFSGEGVIRSDDITRDPRYGKNPPHNGMPKGHLPVRSYLAVPVVGRSGEVIGGLFFGHPDRGRFTDRHESLMTGIAAQAAIAIDNARLYQALQQAKATLEQRVAERTDELQSANEALRQAQKMEAIGQLTGGIAHDFNNMLTVIRGSADVLRRPNVDDDRRQRYLQAITDTADRAARLTSQLLAFARRQALKPESFDAAARIEANSEMLRTLLGSGIELAIRNECSDCFVETDAAQFETALVNMAVNARDAMNGEGELRIGVSRSDRPSTELRPDRDYVAVSVSDTGHGIAAEDLDKIFEPFFTTKEIGKGTGLGLSQVYGFAKQSGGEIVVDSEPGRGTTFTLFLPCAPGHSGGRETKKEQPPDPPGGRVLVVEDNEEVGRFAEQVLRDLGFEAQLTTSAEEALALLDRDGGFEVVFSDVVMPGIGGIELARTIRDRWPNLPVVLTSGYSHVLAAGAEKDFPLVHKPYSLDQLAEVLGGVLAGREPPSPA